MNNVNNLDQRQLILMQERIDLFEQNKINRGKLINDLRALLDNITTSTEKWREEFYDAWFTIEQVHAIALDRGGIHRIEDGEEIIIASLNTMKKLISRLKDQQ